MGQDAGGERIDRLPHGVLHGFTDWQGGHMMDGGRMPPGRGLRLSSDLFLNIEHGVLIALGLVLSLTAVIALCGAAYSLWDGLLNWSGGSGLLLIIDRLLFVLMLAEILHTVRVSIQSGTLNCEPFLIVGLIASIRRVLVITLESSQSTPGKPTAEPGHEAVFQASMIELGVLGGLILVMVVSIFLLRRSGGGDEAMGA